MFLSGVPLLGRAATVLNLPPPPPGVMGIPIMPPPPDGFFVSKKQNNFQSVSGQFGYLCYKTRNSFIAYQAKQCAFLASARKIFVSKFWSI